MIIVSQKRNDYFKTCGKKEVEVGDRRRTNCESVVYFGWLLDCTA